MAASIAITGTVSLARSENMAQGPEVKVDGVLKDGSSANCRVRNLPDNVLLEGEFSLFPKKKVPYRVLVFKEYISFTAIEKDAITNDYKSASNSWGRRHSSSAGNANEPRRIDFQDVIGCHVMRGKDQEDPSSYICIFSYPCKKKLLSKKSTRKRLTTTFCVHLSETSEENMKVAMLWKQAVQRLSKGLTVEDLQSCGVPAEPEKKCLVLINPCSGTGKARSIFKQRILPIFGEAEFNFKCVMTEYANHARDMVKTIDLKEISGIVIVSGDGLIYEVINGLMMRKDWEEAIKTPIGALPGGSGNALCCAINHAAGEQFFDNIILHSAYVLMKHQIVPMDLVVVETTKRRLFSFLSITWGIIADVDIESEKYRRLGAARFTFGALARILNLRTYHGRLSFLPAGEYIPKRRRAKSDSVGGLKRSESTQEYKALNCPKVKRSMTYSESLPSMSSHLHQKLAPSDSILEEAINDQITEQLQDLTIDNNVENQDSEVFADVKKNDHEGKALEQTDDRNINGGTCDSAVPTPLLMPMNEEVPENWVVIDDEFVMVTAAYQTHLGKDMYIAPDSEFDDGLIHLSFVRKGVTRGQLLSSMSALDSGTHLDLPFFESVRVKALRLEPITQGGVIAVDGEVVDYGTIQAQILPSAARIMALQK